MTLGTIGGCSGGTLSGTLFVSPLPGVSWSILDPDSSNDGITISLSPTSGTGPGLVTLTITAAPPTAYSGHSCSDTYTNTYAEQPAFFFSDGGQVDGDAVWMYVVLQ